jgi:signal peptidase
MATTLTLPSTFDLDERGAADDTDDTTPPERPTRPRWRAWAVNAVWLAGLVALAVAVWPTTLGGRFNLTIVSGTSMEPTYHTGDLALVRRTDDIAVGDVIVYAVPAGEPGEGRHVIHRVVGGDATGGWITRGDNRDTPDIWRPRADDIVGTVRGIVPQGGAWLLRVLSPMGVGVAVAIAVVWVFWPRDEGDRVDDPDLGVQATQAGPDAEPGGLERENG